MRIASKEGSVKHIVRISKRAPRYADVVQEFICGFAQILSDILGIWGGSSPLLRFLTDKCDLEPEEEEPPVE